jgi:hypothetical protein
MAVAASDDNLLAQVRAKRTEVERFLAAAVPRRRRLLNTTIVGGTVATALTAAPAVGGAGFTKWLTTAFSLTSPAWQLLCGAAAVSSIAATVATQLLKSQNVEEQVARAQSCRAKLEVLETGLRTGRLDPGQAASDYMRCVEEVAFIHSAS